MIALLAMTGAMSLHCSVSSEGGLGLMVRETAAPVVFEIGEAAFTASGHADLTRLKNPSVERSADQILLRANYEDLSTARLEVAVNPDATRVEWKVIDATGVAGQQTLASHGVGSCKQEPYAPEGKAQ